MKSPRPRRGMLSSTNSLRLKINSLMSF